MKNLFVSLTLIFLSLSSGPVFSENWTVDTTFSRLFAPEHLEINEGDTVTWTNNTGVLHEVRFKNNPTQSNQKKFRKSIKKGDQVSIKFPKPGSYPYVCLWHGMNGTIIVKKTATHQK